MQSGTVFGYQALATGLLRGSGASSPTRTASRRADVKAILTGGLSAAPWARGLEAIDAIDPDLTLKGLAILHAEVSGGERAGARAASMTRRRPGSRAGSIGLGVTGSIAAYKAVELLRLLRAEGADVAVHALAGRDPLRRRRSRSRR